MTKIGFVSLGCSKNLVDTEVMLRTLYDAGYEITPDETEAEIIIINTCGFIESAKQEAIDNILDVAWLKEHGKCRHIIATGCLVERYRESVMEEMPEVDALLGVGSISDIALACDAVMRGERFTSFKDKNTSPLGGERILTTPDHTAYLKIAEGCDNKCTYCAIPLIRGSFRSRTVEDIVKEARELEALGVKELNLIAQDTTRYGLDIYGEYSLARLVRAICAADLAHTAKAATEGGGEAGGELLVQIHFVAEGHKDGLGAVIALGKEGFGFFGIDRHSRNILSW